MLTSYPRKQTVFIFIICVIAVTSAVFYVRDSSPKNSGANDKSLVVNANNEQKTPIATDTDWKKTFFDNNASSSAFKAPTKSSKTLTPDAPLTPTELLGQNFFTKFVELRQAGLTKDTGAITTAANRIIAESVAGVAKPRVYTFNDIKIVSADNNPAIIASYAQALMNILKLDMPVKNETEITMNAFEKGDMTLLAGIDPIISGYQSALDGMISMPAPQPLAQYHLDLLNAISMQVFNAKSLRKADSDPVTALAAVSLEVKSLQALLNAITGMQDYFTKAGFVFVPPVSDSILQSR